MREEIAKKKECINCGICAYYCKDNAISFVEGSDGFEYPCKKDSCLECGLCSKHCIMNQKELTKNNIQNDIQAYIGKYKSSDEVKKSTSGGFCNAISEWVIEQDGVVFGVAYSSDFRKVIYQLVESKEQLKVLRSVKYAQASHLDIKNLEKELQTRRLVLVIGLPCVITAINKWAENKYNNLLTVALICHGPTSILVHRKFLDEVIRKERVNYLNLRKKRGNRRTGWLVMCGDNGKSFVKPWASTTYAAAFNILVRKSCYSCRFKIDTIQADYLVGDYWGRGTKKN